MFTLIIIWFLKDFMQVLAMGIFTVPDFYLMTVIMLALLSNSDKKRQIFYIWAAFLGGFLWDLRWTNLPGLTAATSAAAVGLACYLWHKAPAQGRSLPLFVFFLTMSQLFMGVCYILFWTIPSQVAFRQILVQMLLTVPVIALISLFFWKVYDRHV